MPLNRNLAAWAGTLSGSPVLLDPGFAAAEWQITNRDSSALMTFTVNGQSMTIGPEATVTMEIYSTAAQIDGAAGKYEIEAAEVAGSLRVFR